MSALEFIAILSFEDILFLISLQISIFVFLYRIVSTRQASIIDPFSLTLIFVSSGGSTVVFLLLNGLCSVRLFFVFLLTSAAFFVGYVFAAPPRRNFQLVPYQRLRDYAAFQLMGLSATILVLVNIIANFSIFGFGIEHENRLEIYVDSAGFGILQRCVDALMPVSIFFLTYVIARNSYKRAILALLVFVLFLIFTVLNGSKSGLISIFLVVVVTLGWLHRHWDRRIPLVSGKAAGTVLCTSLVFALLVLSFQADSFDDYERFFGGLAILFYRVVLAADIYVLGFPNDAIDHIAQASNPLVVLFSDFLSTSRLVSLDIVPIGTQLYNFASPIIELNAGGPNAHLGIYSYYLFGEFISPLFCLIVGMTLGVIRKYYNERNISLLNGACVTAIMLNTMDVLLDPGYIMFRITNLLIFLLPLYFICKTVAIRSKASSVS
jgi:hypothetical protein